MPPRPSLTLRSSAPLARSERSIAPFILRTSPTMAGAEDEGADQLGESRAHARIAGAEARLDERLPLPQFGAAGEVGAVAVEREDEGPHPALGAQPQVDAEGITLLGCRFEGVHDEARRAGEEIAVRHAAGLAARRLPVIAIDEDQIDVRGVVELVAAQLAHSDHGQPRRCPLGAGWRAVLGLELLPGPAPRGLEGDIGQPRELLGGDREVGITQNVAAADAEEMAVFEAAEGIEPGLVTGERLKAPREILLELVLEPLPHGPGLEQPRDEGRPAA